MILTFFLDFQGTFKKILAKPKDTDMTFRLANII